MTQIASLCRSFSLLVVEEPIRAIEQPINLARHDEVVLMQSFDLLGAQRDSRITSAEADVWVMAFCLGKLTDFPKNAERFPEIVESTYYLYHFTHDAHYRRMGEKLFNDFVKFCRADAGYAALADVVTKEKRDEMESFALAETFKYFYLLFAPARILDFERVVVNTEAHPLRRTW